MEDLEYYIHVDDEERIIVCYDYAVYYPDMEVVLDVLENATVEGIPARDIIVDSALRRDK